MSAENNLLLETLEERIAPASAVFTDVDGDEITITTSKGTKALIEAAVTGGNAAEIKNIDFTTNPIFKGTDVKVVVTARGAQGDGLANVWKIDSTNQDLGNVTVGGDLAKIVAGDTTYSNGSVKSVTVQSIGVNGGATDKVWALKGGTGAFTVAGSVLGAEIAWSNPDANGKLAVTSITIGGNLIGGAADDTGVIKLTTGMGGTAELKALTIGGNLKATDYDRAGAVLVGDPAAPDNHIGIIGKATIGGSLIGDDNHIYSGTLFASGTIGATKVGGSLVGGGEASGSIYAYNKVVGDVTVGGSLKGGAGQRSGSIFTYNGITKSVTIGGTLEGSSGAEGGSVIAAGGSLSNVKVGSYLFGGTMGVYSGSIYGKTGLGNVWVGGSVFGGGNDQAGFIGTDTGNATNYKAGDITVQGDLIGGSDFSTGIISVGSAGKISIAGSLIGGNNQSGTGAIYALQTVKSIYVGGDLVGDSKSSSGSIRILGANASIASVTIDGTLQGAGGAGSGSVLINGSVDKFTIGGGIGGGSAANAGSLTFGSIKTLNIGTGASIAGSVYGGMAAGAGTINGTTLGSATLSGNLVGGGASGAGKIIISGSAKDITIGGGVFGGAADNTGAIEIGAGGLTGKLTINGNLKGSPNFNDTGVVKVAGKANSVEIKGDILGGDSSMANKSNSGAVLVTGALKTITIGGDIKAGIHFNNTDLNLGAVRAGSIDTMLVKGSLVGANSNSRVLITAQGDTTKTSGVNLAIKSLTVNGSVSNAAILGGYNTTGTTKDADGGSGGGGAQFGTITINGDFFNGSIATGVENNAANYGNWADNNDALLSANPIVASIAKIVIKGAATADTQSGISAEQIKSLTIGNSVISVAPGATFIDPITPNFKLQQVIA